MSGFMSCIVVVPIFFDDAKRGKSKYSGTRRLRWFILRRGSSVFHGDLCSNLMRYVSCFVLSMHSYLTGLVRGNRVLVIWLKFLGGT